MKEVRIKEIACGVYDVVGIDEQGNEIILTHMYPAGLKAQKLGEDAMNDVVTYDRLGPVSYVEATSVAFKVSYAYDSCIEYPKGYYFYTHDTDNDGIVVIKSNGGTVSLQAYKAKFGDEEGREIDILTGKPL